jgi:hypothetical protein
MDPLSITASIIAVLQLTNSLVEFLNDVKDASKERAQCAIEASNLYSLLVNLRFRIEGANSNAPWFTATHALTVQNGPFDQYKSALEQLRSKVVQKDGIRKITDALKWKFSKEGIMNVLSRIERLKSHVHIILEMDHLLVLAICCSKIKLLTTLVNYPKQSKMIRAPSERSYLTWKLE